jgi:dipeptidyl aminopeptidase/acylaminoacyl peptidase
MTDPVPLDAYYDLSMPSSPTVSPDGERVAFVVRESDPDEDEHRRSVFVAPADGSRDPHRLTRMADAGNPRWSPDGSRLAVTAAREEDVELAVAGDEGDDSDQSEDDVQTDEAEADDGDEADDAGPPGGDEPRSKVWVFDLERGGDPRQVTDFDEGVREFDWGPEAERIVVSARDPTDEEREYLTQRREEDGPIETERLQHKFNGAGWLDTVTTYLFVVDVETRETTKLEDAAGRGAYEASMGLQPAWAPGERIAFVTNRTDDPDDSYEMDVHTIAPDGSDRRRLTEGRMAQALAWSPDGERLAYVNRPPDNWYVPTEVQVVDVESGEHRSLSGSLDRTIAWGGHPTWLDDGTMVALIGDGGWTRPVRLHAGGEARSASGSPSGSGDAEAERVFDRLPRDETVNDLDADGDTIAVVRSHPSEGLDVYAMPASGLDAGEGDDDPRVRLSAFNDEFVADHDLPEATRTTFESDDGETVEAICYYPAEFDPDDPEPHPTVVKIHGGPMSYDEPGFGIDETLFTSRGYLVLEVNYRGSTSYGREFCEYLRGNWNTMDVADLQAGVDAAVERGWADPERLFCTGFSQGGINTAYLVTQTDRFAAAAAEHGVYDLRADFGNGDLHRWYETDYGLPWEEPEAYDRASSITDVGGVDTPLLLTAGGQDWRCPPTQSEQLYVAVRKQGVPARLVVYPEEHHNIGDPERATHRYEELTGWFERFDEERDD